MKEIKITIIAVFFVVVLFFSRNVFAATEFVSIVDPDNGSGTDYTSLSAWETGVQTDLTSSATRVFFGTKTGTIADNTALYLCRSGVYQVHSGTLVHASSTQARVELISGAATEQDGDVWYTNNTCNSASYFTVSSGGDGAIAVASCRSSSGGDDTAAVHLTGWTTSATNYIKIWTDPGAGNRHKGRWDDSKYNIKVASDAGFRISEEFVRIEGIQIYITAATSTDDSAIWINTPAAGWKIYISECILRGAGSASYWHAGVESYATTAGTAYVSNCIAYDFKSSVVGAAYMIDASGAGGDGSMMYVYNSTAYNSGYGYRRYDTGINLYVKNDIAQNCTDGFAGTYDTNSDYNISDLGGDAPGAHSKNTTNVIFADEANYDLHLGSSDVAAINSGTDLSDDASLNFNADIDGDIHRVGSIWDIGPDEFDSYIRLKGDFKFRGNVKFR